MMVSNKNTFFLYLSSNLNIQEKRILKKQRDPSILESSSLRLGFIQSVHANQWKVLESSFSTSVSGILLVVRGDRDSRGNLMPIYGDLNQIKL